MRRAVRQGGAAALECVPRADEPMFFSPARCRAPVELSGRDAYNALVSMSTVVLQRPSDSTVGALPGATLMPAEEGERPTHALARALERGPDDKRTALVVAADEAGKIADWLLSPEGGLRRVFLCSERALMERHAFLFSERMLKLGDQEFPSEIIPGLYLGSRACARNAAALELLDVTEVISVVSHEFTLEHIAPERHLWLEADDDDTWDMTPVWDAALPTIAAALAAGRKLLVHCERGASRSVAVVCAHLLVNGSAHDVYDALRQVSVCRPCAQPNPGFLQQLRELEARTTGAEVEVPSLSLALE